MKTYSSAALAAFLALGIGMAQAHDAASADATRDFDWTSQDPRMAQVREAMEAEAWGDAARILVRIVVDAPENAEAYIYLGRSYRRLGEPEQALIYYDHALRLQPDHRGALAELGELLLDLNEPRKAEALLGRLARICGPDCEAYRALDEEVRQYRAARPRG